MTQVVIENPVINSPFEEPTRHFRFGDEGITNELVEGRRRSSYFVPIAQPHKQAQKSFFETEWVQERIQANQLINDIRGRVARWRQKSSLLGRELDSLADVISFGVAPALIAYGCGMQGLWDRAVLVFFVACGVSRLARFNVTADALSAGSGKVSHFEGTPIPTSILLVLLLWAAAAVGAVGPQLWGGAWRVGGFTLHPLVLLYALSGSLMISRIRIPKL